MGAWGAAHLAFKYPQLFSAATLISAPMRTFDRFQQMGSIFSFTRSAFYAEDPVTRARRDSATLKNSVRVRIRIGDQDTNFYLAVAFDQQLRGLGYRCDLVVLPWVRHDDEATYSKLGREEFRFYKELFAGRSY